MTIQAGTRISRSSGLLDPDILSISVLNTEHRAVPRVAFQVRISRLDNFKPGPRFSPNEYPPGFLPAAITSS